jgi:hypothetical protein
LVWGRSVVRHDWAADVRRALRPAAKSQALPTCRRKDAGYARPTSRLLRKAPSRFWHAQRGPVVLGCASPTRSRCASQRAAILWQRCGHQLRR